MIEAAASIESVDESAQCFTVRLVKRVPFHGKQLTVPGYMRERLVYMTVCNRIAELYNYVPNATVLDDPEDVGDAWLFKVILHGRRGCS